MFNWGIAVDNRVKIIILYIILLNEEVSNVLCSGKEVWKDIEFLNNNYSVSNMGNIRSNDRTASDGRHIKGRVMRLYAIKPRGYLTAVVMVDGKKKHYLVHRLVYCIFNNLDINGDFDIDHKDNNPTNNCLDNLQRMTHKDNIIKGFESRKECKEQCIEYKVPKYTGNSCNKKGNEKSIIQYDLSGNKMKEYKSLIDASIDTGVCKNSISRNLRGIYKNAGGYVWKYKE